MVVSFSLAIFVRAFDVANNRVTPDGSQRTSTSVRISSGYHEPVSELR